MTNQRRPNRCDSLLALIDECLADYERSTRRPTHPRLTRRRRAA